MKFLAATILTALLAFVSGLYFPWWGITLAALVTALIVAQRAGKAFLSGFLGVLLLWCGLAWWIDMKNNGILSQKIATILPLSGNSLLLILVTGIIGGLVAGFAAMSGSFIRSANK